VTITGAERPWNGSATELSSTEDAAFIAGAPTQLQPAALTALVVATAPDSLAQPEPTRVQFSGDPDAMLAEVLLTVASSDLQALQEELRKLLLDRPGALQERLSVHTFSSSVDANGLSPPAVLARVLGMPPLIIALPYSPYQNTICGVV
jgi:hypothetical protein